jgi:hypothetical protein
MAKFLGISILACLFFLTTNQTSIAQSEARAVLDRAIKAHGGEEALVRLKAAHCRSKGSIQLGDSIPFTQEVYYQLPGSIKEIQEIEHKGQKMTVVLGMKGDDGWITVNGKPQMNIDPKDLQLELKETANLLRVSRLVPLKEKTFELTVLGRSMVGDQEAVGIRASAKGYRDVNLFFGKDSGLLLKLERKTKDLLKMQDVSEERVMSDYRQVDGLQSPRKMVVYRDGAKFMEAEVTEIRFLEKLEDSIFERP